MNTNQRRSRGRPGSNNGGNHNNGGGRRNSRNQNFESNGPEVKVRGSAQQVLDKYLQFARDAQSRGDRVKAEGYLQYAEHYYRIVNVEPEVSEAQPPRAKVEGKKNEHGSSRPNAPRAGDPEKPREPRRSRRPANGSGPARTPAPVPVKNEATLAAEAAATATASKPKANEKKSASDAPAAPSEDSAVVGE